MHKELEEAVARLPRGRAELKLLPFLDVWPEGSQEAMELRQSISDPRYVLSTIANRKLNASLVPAAEDFLSWCCFDLNEEIEEIQESFELHPVWWDVLVRRAKGETLEVISKRHELTRERIRQIGVRCVSEFIARDGEKMVGRIYALENGRELITEKVLEKYFHDDARTYFYLMMQASMALDTPANFAYRYDEKMNGLIYGKRNEASIQAAIQYVHNMPNAFPGSALPEYLEKAARQGHSTDTVAACITGEYIQRGDSWRRGKVRIHNICTGVLERYYPNGIYIYDSGELKRFRDYAMKTYGNAVTLPEHDHALTAVIGRIGMLCGRGIYRPMRHGVLPEDVLEEIRKYMRDGGQESYMFNTLFTVFKDKLTAHGVDNRFYLQGVLKADLGENYEFTRDYVTQTGKVNKIQNEILATVSKYDRPVSKEELSTLFPGVPEIAISYALMSDEIVNYFGSYINVDKLNLKEEDRQIVLKEARDMVSDGKAHQARELLSRCQNKYPELLERIFIRTQFAMYSFLACISEDEFEMDRPMIAGKNTKGGEELRTQRREELAARKTRDKSNRNRKMVTYDELVEYVRSCGRKGTTVNELHGRFHATRQHLTILEQDARIIMMQNTMVHVDNIKDFETARDAIADLLEPLMKEYGVLRKPAVYLMCINEIPDFFNKNDMNSEDSVFYFCRHLFEKTGYRDIHWYFRMHSQCISLYKDGTDVSFCGQVTDYCRRLDRPVTYAELKERFMFLGYKTNSLKYNMKLCESPLFYIYKPDVYIMCEKMPLTDAWLDQVRDKVQEAIRENDGLVVLRRLTDAWCQENLPPVPYKDLPWTTLLLQQICIFYPDRIGARPIRSFGIYDYNNIHSFLVDNETGPKYLQEALWIWLIREGYGGKTLKVSDLWGLFVEEKLMDDSVMNSAGQFNSVMKDPAKYEWDLTRRTVKILQE